MEDIGDQLHREKADPAADRGPKWLYVSISLSFALENRSEPCVLNPGAVGCLTADVCSSKRSSEVTDDAPLFRSEKVVSAHVCVHLCVCI